MGVKVLFLDFDGVIADSMPVKGAAMIEAFAGYDAAPDDIVEGFRRYAGSGRELIFDRIFEHVTGKALHDAERARIEEAYVGRLEANRSDLGLFPGVETFVADQAAKRSVAVVTGVPQAEVEKDLKRLALSDYFVSVHSATRREPKHVLMQGFLGSHGIAAADALFVGDSLSDMQAAARAAVPFVGVGEPNFFAGGASIAVVDCLIDIVPLFKD
jgi:phosphoglycolate phosphatase